MTGKYEFSIQTISLILVSGLILFVMMTDDKITDIIFSIPQHDSKQMTFSDYSCDEINYYMKTREPTQHYNDQQISSIMKKLQDCKENNK